MAFTFFFLLLAALFHSLNTHAYTIDSSCSGQDRIDVTTAATAAFNMAASARDALAQRTIDPDVRRLFVALFFGDETRFDEAGIVFVRNRFDAVYAAHVLGSAPPRKQGRDIVCNALHKYHDPVLTSPRQSIVTWTGSSVTIMDVGWTHVSPNTPDDVQD